MKTTVNIARYDSHDIRIAHCMLPAWNAEEYVSTSRASSIAISFTAQHKAVVQLESARCVTRNIPGNSIGIAGASPISWIRVNEPSECLEITASPALRREIADELCVLDAYELDDHYGLVDPVASIVMCRLRALVRATHQDGLEIDSLVRHLYARMLVTLFGGRLRVRGDGALSRQRLAQTLSWLQANLMRPLSIGDLAAAAALSPAHFIRSFKRSTGLSPYQFVRLRRLERSREALQRGASLASAARAAHFSSISQFRTAYYDAFGHAAQHTPRRGARIWVQPGVKPR
jgi:AraC family transcriptional regulator